MNNEIKRPAFGQIASVGTLYDAKTDKFLSSSILNQELAAGVTSRDEIGKKNVQLSYEITFADKFERLAVGPELGADILCGSVSPGGSGCCLREPTVNGKALHAAVYHTLSTARERLDLQNDNFKACLDSTVLRTSEVSHVVVEIEYGATNVVTARHWLAQNSQESHAETEFRKQMEKFEQSLRQAASNTVANEAGQPENALQLEIMAYSSTLNAEGIVMQNFQEVHDFFEVVAQEVMYENSGKGKPIFYKLLPVSMLTWLCGVRVENDMSTNPPAHECLKKFVQLFDDFHTTRQELDGYRSYVAKHQLCLAPDQLQNAREFLKDLASAEENLRTNYAAVLMDVRKGKSDPEKLWRLLTDSSQGDQSPCSFLALAKDHREKVEFFDSMTSQGAVYIGYNGLDLKTELAKRSAKDAYVLFFSDKAMRDQESWNVNKSLILQLLEKSRNGSFIAIVDCDATTTELEKAVVTQYQNGLEHVANLVEMQQFLVDNCFAKCLPQHLDTNNKEKPLQRRIVKIACPGAFCEKGKVHDWRCPTCLAPLEYGFSDHYIYCDCGRGIYDKYHFKCKEGSHGRDFERYDPTELLAMLNSLDQSDYLNILILGETGVGKSTFINAFVNYLYFDSLDKALSASELQWLIPCSFSANMMDRSQPDGAILQRKIMVGSRTDEHDGTDGQAATQRTVVYPITVGTTTYRLIDTPGIGDTRGIEYDKKNMADILTTLGGYDQVHGILILLKTNNARITAHFSFCLKELLSHLHRSATRNVVFGFTNTRITNYEPGDTFNSLKSLLEENPNIGLSLPTKCVYCFDSESFRYLAAFKSGFVMNNKQDFVSSWEKSSREAWRMLDHFKSSTPHPTRSTLSLNGTARLISELVKPMADITGLIRTNISIYEDQVKRLKDARLSGDKLRLALRPRKKCLKTKELTQHRTVCADKDCVEFKDDGSGNNVKLTDYLKHCHPACWLTNVDVEVIGHPQLINCAAFTGGICNLCGHQWMQHMHVMYELESYMTTVTDKGIEEELKNNASKITNRQAAIKIRQILMDEYEKEHDQIQEAAAKFVLWMRNNSIIPYNDATLKYLDVLIEHEEAKVNAGGTGNQAILRSLRQERAKHLELVALFTREMKSVGKSEPIDQDGVKQLVEHLYKLKHFGNNLEHLKTSIAEIHQATNRELCHRVQHTRQNRGKARKTDWFSQMTSWLPYQPTQSSHYSNAPSTKRHSMQPGLASGTMRTRTR